MDTVYVQLIPIKQKYMHTKPHYAWWHIYTEKNYMEETSESL